MQSWLYVDIYIYSGKLNMRMEPQFITMSACSSDAPHDGRLPPGLHMGISALFFWAIWIWVKNPIPMVNTKIAGKWMFIPINGISRDWSIAMCQTLGIWPQQLAKTVTQKGWDLTSDLTKQRWGCCLQLHEVNGSCGTQRSTMKKHQGF